MPSSRFSPVPLILACLFALGLAPLAFAALPHAALSVAPIPAWVETPLDPMTEIERPAAAESGLDYYVNERQEAVAERAAFIHLAYRVTDAASLTDAAEFAVTFNPDYETVALHHLRIIRDGRAEDRLDPDGFEILRQERDRDRAIYDGRLTAIHQMRDVRVGDIVHFAYTRTGANPVFAGRFSRTLSLGWSMPARQFRIRIVHPAARPLHWRTHGEGSFPPAVSSLPRGLVELRWERTPLPAVNAEGDTPAWHVDYPYVQIGEYAAWADVVSWALPLYTPDTSHPAVQAEIEKLRALSTDPDERVAAALRFVQEDIRYLAIALGTGTHQPSPPAETLERRFGDCKDKTLLLCSLLRGLGIEADPALVNTYSGKALPDSLPTPLVFDHVIARVVLPDGRVLWLDPTRLHQTGPLHQRMSSDFAHALPLRRDTSRPVMMDLESPATSRLHEAITFTSHGLDQPVDMEIVSTFTGERATRMRARLADTTSARITRDYLNYYLQKFPGLTSTETVSWTDDRDTNRVRIVERYRVPDFWSAPGERGVITAEIYPHSVGALVGSPANQDRRAPLGIDHPINTLVEVSVRLHSDWEVPPLDLHIDNGHLQYISKARYENRVLNLSYFFRTKFDHVPANEVADYARTLAQIRGDLTLTLTHTPAAGATSAAVDATEEDAAFRLNPWAAAICALTLLCSVVLSWRVLARPRRRGVPPPFPPTAPALAIGGWLILAAIGVIVRPIMLLSSISPFIPTFFDADAWQALMTGGEEVRNPPLALLLLAGVGMNSILLVFMLLAGILFFMRRREAPRWNIIVLIGGTIFVVIDSLATYLITGMSLAPEALGQLVGQPVAAAVGTCIWVPYFMFSKRVAATFVR